MRGGGAPPRREMKREVVRAALRVVDLRLVAVGAVFVHQLLEPVQPFHILHKRGLVHRDVAPWVPCTQERSRERP